jgi:hypothetical protein
MPSQDIERFCQLTKNGRVHPELLFDQQTLQNLRNMMHPNTQEHQNNIITFGMTQLALLAAMLLGSALTLTQVLNLYQVLEELAPNFPHAKQTAIFNDVRRRIQEPSSLAVLSRHAVRCQVHGI